MILPGTVRVKLVSLQGEREVTARLVQYAGPNHYPPRSVIEFGEEVLARDGDCLVVTWTELYDAP